MDLTPTPSSRLDGRRALVTGAGRGIGLTAASALGRRRRACDARCPHVERNRGSSGRHPCTRATGRHADARRHRHRRGAQGACPTRALPDPGQQCRHEPAGDAAGRDGGRLRRHLHAKRARGLLRGADGGDAAAGGEAPRLDHQHLLANGPCRRRASHGLLRLEARHGGLHQGDGDRAGAAQHPRQLARAYFPGDADDAAVLREQGVPRRGIVEDQARPARTVG